MKLRSNRVYKLPRVEKEEELVVEKELVARAVDAAKIVLEAVQRPAYSYDVAAVGTAANLSLEQETEDDDRLSTTSTIEFYYSEEEQYYYSEGEEDSMEEDAREEDSREDACEDDRCDEEDPTKNVHSNLEVLEMEEDDQGTILSDPSDIEELSMEAVTSDEEWESSTEKLSKEDWIASWNKLDPQKHLTWINVYAYYRKKKNGKGYGGYGVIIRYADAKPVIATAKYSKVGISFFHQLLMGIKAGVKLSKEHNLSGRYVICNSTEIERVIKHAFNCRTDKCRTSYSHNFICKGCKDYLDSCVGCDMGLWPLIQDLKQEGGLDDLVKYPRTSNEAAHYLAKMAKAKHGVKKLKGIAGDDEDLGEIKPDKFPSKLKDILWKDSVGGMTCYRASSG